MLFYKNLKLQIIVFITFALTGNLFAQDTINTQITNDSVISFKVFTVKEGIPVIVESDTVLFIYQSIGPLKVEERASVISDRIKNLKENYIAGEDSLYLLTGAQNASIIFNNELIIQTFYSESNYEGKELTELSEERYALLEKYLSDIMSKEETWLQYLISAGIILAALLLIHYMLRGLFRKINLWIGRNRNKYLKGIKIKDFEMMDANDETELVLKLVWALRIVLMLIIASIIFPIIFSFFPATKFIAEELIALVYEPFKNFLISFVNYIPNLITILVIVFVVRFILKYLRLFSDKIAEGKIKLKGFYPDWSKTTFDIIKVLIITLSFVMVFPYLPGGDSAVFKGVSVFIGVLFSIGSTSIVGNLIASLVLTYMRPFEIGDRIKVGDIEGEIMEKTAFVLRIKTPKNEYITIPNSNVMSSHITNYNKSFKEGGVILFTEITIGYEVPWRKVHEMLLRAADLTEDLEKEPKPFVLQKMLGDFSVGYQINAYSKRPLYKDLINSRMHQNIQDIFTEENVEILSPNYMAQRDGNESTVPKSERREKED